MHCSTVYMLNCRWKPPKMLDATMAIRIRHITLIAIAAHLYATSRFVYSWPMDDTYRLPNSPTGESLFGKVNKDPPYNIFFIKAEVWHSPGQAATVLIYKNITIAALVFGVAVILGRGIADYLQALFSSHFEANGEAIDIPFFSVPKIGCYCPIVERNGEAFVCAITSQAMEEFQSSVAAAESLTYLVPEKHIKSVLAFVKWFGLGKLNNRSNAKFSSKTDAQATLTRALVQKDSKLGRLASFKRKINPSLSAEPHMGNILQSFDKFKPSVDSEAGGELHLFESSKDLLRDFLDRTNVSLDTAASTPNVRAPKDSKTKRRKIKRRTSPVTPLELNPLVLRGYILTSTHPSKL